jgi:hypothetical protein
MLKSFLFICLSVYARGQRVNMVGYCSPRGKFGALMKVFVKPFKIKPFKKCKPISIL